ncbi:branched-chain amino acid ABC transporter substrate-binding protein [Yinghuangia sp. ASG 101]|uniref:branched-chain amino acid ABC transporter substrate-binding protein n=1 Tax=Yinghuangia sp. ASG 101 TaxID=2896848 RepID=UPI001E5474FD|nr:branched-chain amino acid ABC transporter substrate-binding protein [Yinghuangia sp. ASG 101]UGQ10113.1 branched-chain amino acid ABC transporter substrate-binding protein [Yinghuangia sp. ASG 101]
MSLKFARGSSEIALAFMVRAVCSFRRPVFGASCTGSEFARFFRVVRVFRGRLKEWAVLRRRVIGFGLPLAVSALVLGGCGGGGSGGGDDGGVRTYAIGFQAGLSGADAQFALNEANGVELAVEKFNSSPRAPFRVRLVKSDDAGSAEQAVPAARRLIDDGDVVAVVGPVGSASVRASGRLYAEAGLAAVSPSATSPGLTDPGNGFTSLLRAVPSDAVQGAGIASYYAGALGLRSVVVVDDATEYGAGLADAVEAGLGRAGVGVVAVSAPKGSGDFGPALAAVRGSGAEGLVYAGDAEDAALFARDLRQAGVTVPVIAGDRVKEARFVEAAGDAAENWLVACPCADLAADAAARAFVAEHTAKFKTEPGAYAAEAYDVANMVIEEIGRLDAAGARVTREAVLSGLRKGSYRGLARSYAFGAGGEFAGEALRLYQVRSGRIEYVGGIDGSAA